MTAMVYQPLIDALSKQLNEMKQREPPRLTKEEKAIMDIPYRDARLSKEGQRIASKNLAHQTWTESFLNLQMMIENFNIGLPKPRS
jgi:hypothetical protein